PLSIGGFYGGSAIAASVGLGTIWQMVIGGLTSAVLSRPAESAMEAGAQYDDAIARGKTIQEAKEEADEVFRNNMTLAGADAFEIAIALAPTPKWVPTSLINSGLVRIVRIGSKIVIVGLSEGGEELYQDLIQRRARGEEFKLDPVSKEVFAIGFVMGAGMGLGGDVISGIVNRSRTEMSTEMRKQFDDNITRFKAEGINQSESELRALDEIAQTPEGERIVQEAVDEAKAEVPAKEVAPVTGVSTEQLWNSLDVPDRASLARQANLEGEFGSKTWDELSKEQQGEILLAREELIPARVEPVVAPEVTGIGDISFEQVKDFFGVAQEGDRVLGILPDGTPLKAVGFGAFQHRGVGSVEQWLDAGIIRVVPEENGTIDVEIRGGITNTQKETLIKTIQNSQGAIVDITDIEGKTIREIPFGSPSEVIKVLEAHFEPQPPVAPVEPVVAGETVDVSYNRHTRSWVVERRDSQGNKVVGEEFFRNKLRAQRAAERLRAEIALKTVVAPEVTVFKQTTDVPFYDDFIREPIRAEQKDYEARIVQMSPDEYLTQTAKMQGTDITRQIEQTTQELIDELASKMARGTKIDMPYLDFKLRIQEGRNRALAAKKLGVTQMPVLIASDIGQLENVIAGIKVLEPKPLVAPEVTEVVPEAEPGAPEAGLQETMLPEEVPAKEVRPKGKGKVVQISMEDQLKLEEAKQEAEKARVVEPTAKELAEQEEFEAREIAEGIR
ncbi:hypothetical protein LCGC14_2022840, partial [marine sediment metagenome]